MHRWKTIGEFTVTHFRRVSVTNSLAVIVSLTLSSRLHSLLSHVLLKNTTGNVLLLDVVIETQINS